MEKTSLRLAAVAIAAAIVSACAPGTMPTVSPDGQRALIGAGAGAVAAKAFDGDVAKGALVGAAAGALCDDVALCPPAAY